jgi:hypothetical protein
MKIFHNNSACPSKQNGNNIKLSISTQQSRHSDYINTGYIYLNLSV